MKRGFAARRGNEYALLLLALLVYFTLRSNGLRPCLGTEFRLAEVKFRWIFEEALKKGCLQTFEELSQKPTIVLP